MVMVVGREKLGYRRGSSEEKKKKLGENVAQKRRCSKK
jgi:hypothetical protein